jgi:hypothetical protein
MFRLPFVFVHKANILSSAWTVKGRNRFRSDGQNANLGVKAYGFTWGAFACFFIATITFCLGGSVGREKRSSGLGRKGSKRSRHSRGSFIGSERGGVKDDYS